MLRNNAKLWGVTLDWFTQKLQTCIPVLQKVEHYYFLTSLAARVPGMVGPTIRCTHLRLSLRTKLHGERDRTRDIHFCQHKAQQWWCGSGAGDCSHLPNPAGSLNMVSSFLIVPKAAASLVVLACDVVPTPFPRKQDLTWK